MQVCRNNLKWHIQAATSDHLDLARIKLIATNEEQQKLKEQTIKEHEELKERTRKLEERFDSVLKENEQLKQTKRRLEEKLNYTIQLLFNMNKSDN